MFGGTAAKLNQIEEFAHFGLIAKSITVTKSGKRTEDMKLFHINFSEFFEQQIIDEDGTVRERGFEDSEFYSYFADHEFLCIIFEEPDHRVEERANGLRIHIPNELGDNRFIGFKRIVFSDAFIDGAVRRLWEDTKHKVLDGMLKDVVKRRKDGSVVINPSGEVSSAPNFMKSRENDVFIRCSGPLSIMRYKTECVNGIHMLPQYVWIKGSAIVEELNQTPEI